MDTGKSLNNRDFSDSLSYKTFYKKFLTPYDAVAYIHDYLKEGMVIAVEPMITAGSPRIFIHDNDWTIDTEDGRPSAHFEHTVVVTADGYEILTGE